MTVKLNEAGYRRARRLIDDGNYVLDDRGAWSEHQPATRQENAFIEQSGWEAYRRWHAPARHAGRAAEPPGRVIGGHVRRSIRRCACCTRSSCNRSGTA